MMTTIHFKLRNKTNIYYNIIETKLASLIDEWHNYLQLKNDDQVFLRHGNLMA